MEDWEGAERDEEMGGCASEALGCVRSTEHSEEVVGDFSAAAAPQRHLSVNPNKSHYVSVMMKEYKRIDLILLLIIVV